MTSRPDRPVDDVRTLEREASYRRASYAPTPSFVLVKDESPSEHVSAITSLTPLLRVKPYPLTTSVSRNWFNPTWIDEETGPDVDHGEFQSPVWLAVHMTMRADRDREVDEDGVQWRGRRSNDDPRSGQLRSLLAFVNNTKRTAISQHSPDTSTMGRTVAAKVGANSRYHELPPRHAKQPGKFVHFISSSLRRSASITTERRLGSY
jgi:hypothetical protein